MKTETLNYEMMIYAKNGSKMHLAFHGDDNELARSHAYYVAFNDSQILHNGEFNSKPDEIASVFWRKIGSINWRKLTK